MARAFRDRIRDSAKDKHSSLVLALDLTPRHDIGGSAMKMIGSLQQYICAVKINLHLLLPLSFAEISSINKLAHSYGLQCIADIKLNDIENTNKVALDYLTQMGFDATILNPFIGRDALRKAVSDAHGIDAGILALVYMSHPGAKEGYGLEIIEAGSNGGRIPLYREFLSRASESNADGIIVGATQLEILKDVSKRKLDSMPVYSPGIGVQGGEIEQAARSGVNYFIVGRSIIESDKPAEAAEKIQGRIVSASQAQG